MSLTSKISMSGMKVKYSEHSNPEINFKSSNQINAPLKMNGI